MTVYRAYDDINSLLADLMTREWLHIMAPTTTAELPPPSPEQIADQVVAAVRALRANPLFHRIIDVDPELLLPYLLERPGRSQQAVLTALTEAIGRAQQVGVVRAADPALLARSILLAAHGFALSQQTMTCESVSAADLEVELALLITRFLKP